MPESIIKISTSSSQYGSSGDIALISGNARDSSGGVSIIGGSSVAGIGGILTLSSGSSKAARGGSLNLYTGDGYEGGSLDVSAGEGTKRGGDIFLRAGRSPRGKIGFVEIRSGESTEYSSSSLNIGVSSISLQSSTSEGAPSTVVFQSGVSSETFSSGSLRMVSGNSKTQVSDGDVLIASGAHSSGAAGSLILESRHSAGNSGSIVLNADTTTPGSSAGNILISSVGDGGSIDMRSDFYTARGVSLASMTTEDNINTSGEIVIRTGSSELASSGPVRISGGRGVGSGGVVIDGGDAVVTGGNLQFQAGSASSQTGDAGSISLSAGIGSKSGNVLIQAGSSTEPTEAGSVSSMSGQFALRTSGEGISLITDTGAVSGSIKLKTSASLTKSGDVEINAGGSYKASKLGGSVHIHADASYGKGGDVVISAGESVSGQNGGSIVMKAGLSDGQSGVVSLATGDALGSKLSMSDSTMDMSIGRAGSRISLSVPLSEKSKRASSLELGFTRSDGMTKKVDLRMQSTVTSAGKDSSMVVASAPMHVTAVHYSSDMRIKKDIQPVNTESILQRIKKIPVRSYKYTDEWLQVRDDVPDVRVRGVIAQELAEVFPEYVTSIPEYTLDDKNFTINDFHQVDKTSLIVDLIAAMQALGERFVVEDNLEDNRSSEIRVVTAGSSDVPDSDVWGSGRILLQSGSSSDKSSGGIDIRTGDSTASSAGSIRIAGGVSGGGKGADISISAGDVTSIHQGGNVEVVSGGSHFLGGNVLLRSASASRSGDVQIVSGDAISNVGDVSIVGGRGTEGGNIYIRASSPEANVAVSSDEGKVVLQQLSSVLALSELEGVSISAGNGGGDISLKSGFSDLKNGGDLSLFAGDSGSGSGGSIFLRSGTSLRGSSGEISLITSRSSPGIKLSADPELSMSGVLLETRHSDRYSGDVIVSTGDAAVPGNVRLSSYGTIGMDSVGENSAVFVSSESVELTSSKRGVKIETHAADTEGIALRTSTTDTLAGGIVLSTGDGALSSSIEVLVGTSANSGGNINLRAGEGLTGGNVHVVGGAGRVGLGGEASVVGGDGAGTASGGSARLIGGDATLTGSGGQAHVRGGSSLNAGQSESVVIEGGLSGGSQGGSVRINAGTSMSTAGGDVVISSGSGVSKSGNVVLSSASMPLASSGSLELTTGDAASSVGSLRLRAGSGAVSGGSIDIIGGAGDLRGGSVRIETSRGMDGVGGELRVDSASLLSLSTHSDVEGNSGSIVLATGTSSVSGGVVELRTGNAFHNSAGSILVSPGLSVDGERGADVTIGAGALQSTAGRNGVGGSLTLTGGDSLAGDHRGGDVSLRGGASVSGSGGSVSIEGGHSVGLSSGKIAIGSKLASAVALESGSSSIRLGHAAEGSIEISSTNFGSVGGIRMTADSLQVLSERSSSSDISGSVLVGSGDAPHSAGSVSLIGGNGNLNGGSISIKSGTGKISGSVDITSGTNSDGSLGGTISLSASTMLQLASSSHPSTDSGSVRILSGMSGHQSGSLSLISGAAGEVSGDLLLSSGISSKHSGDVAISTGSSLEKHFVAGKIAMEAGDGEVADGAGTASGGSARLIGGDATLTGSGGQAHVRGGSSLNAGQSESVVIEGGLSGGSQGGSVRINAGTSMSTAGGDVVISSGSGVSKSGNVVLSSASMPLASSGSLELTTGDAASSVGSLRLRAGSGAVSGGSIDIIGGAGDLRGGSVRIETSRGMDGVGGELRVDSASLLSLSTHSDVEGNSGSIVLATGTSSVSGGVVELRTGNAFHNSAGSILVSPGLSVDGERGADVTIGAVSAEAQAYLEAAEVYQSKVVSRLTVEVVQFGWVVDLELHWKYCKGLREFLSLVRLRNLIDRAPSTFRLGKDRRTRATDIITDVAHRSGLINIATGEAGSSGSVRISSGSASEGATGDVNLQSGSSIASSKAGSVQLSAGTGSDGGAIRLSAGQGQLSGGIVSLNSGGSVAAGVSGHADGAVGGGMAFTSGSSDRGVGGSITVVSATGSMGSGEISLLSASSLVRSGEVKLQTGSSDIESGKISIFSGSSSQGKSGSVALTSGDSAEVVGDIELTTGTGSSGGNAVISSLTGGFTSSSVGFLVESRGKDSAVDSFIRSSDKLLQVGTNTKADSSGISISSGDGDSKSGNIVLSTGRTREVGSLVGDIMLLSGTGGVGGNIVLRSGGSSDANGGISIEGGSSDSVQISAGDSSVTSTSGMVSISGGSSYEGPSNGGDINIYAGAAGESSGGNVIVSSGHGKKSGNKLGLGSVPESREALCCRRDQVKPQLAPAGDNSGSVSIISGHAYQSGGIFVSSGDSSQGTAGSTIHSSSGSVLLRTGDSAFSAGSFHMKPGASNDGLGGAVEIVGGDSKFNGGGLVNVHGGAGQEGGDVAVRGGDDSEAGIVGDLRLQAGVSGSASPSGSVVLVGGLSHEGRGGAIDVTSGSSMLDIGGSLSLRSGTSSSTSGVVVLGSGSGGAKSGDVSISTGDSMGTSVNCPAKMEYKFLAEAMTSEVGTSIWLVVQSTSKVPALSVFPLSPEALNLGHLVSMFVQLTRFRLQRRYDFELVSPKNLLEDQLSCSRGTVLKTWLVRFCYHLDLDSMVGTFVCKLVIHLKGTLGMCLYRPGRHKAFALGVL
eukprot:gene4090-2913_t